MIVPFHALLIVMIVTHVLIEAARNGAAHTSIFSMSRGATSVSFDGWMGRYSDGMQTLTKHGTEHGAHARRRWWTRFWRGSARKVAISVLGFGTPVLPPAALGLGSR